MGQKLQKCENQKKYYPAFLQSIRPCIDALDMPNKIQNIDDSVVKRIFCIINLCQIYKLTKLTH